MSVPSASLQPYVRQAGEHQRLAYPGGAELAVILDAAITGGQLTVFDNHGRQAPAHRFISTAATTRRSCCWTGR
jgi:hypothetical protein